jgi:hypothetical protein
MDAILAQLEDTLRQQIAAHEQLLSLMTLKREAIRSAQASRVAELVSQESAQLRIVTELEKRRLEQVAAATLAVDPSAAQPLRLGELALRLPEPARGRLLVLRQQARAKVEQVSQQAGVLREATTAVARHMQGLVQSIGGVLTGVPTYSAKGAPPRSATRVSTFVATA